MAFNSPDLETFKNELDNSISAILKLNTNSHTAIKIQSLLNITVYVLATRFLEGSVKHLIYNCCIMRGDSSAQLVTLESELKGFNNPEYGKIKDLFTKHLNFDITIGLTNGYYAAKDISLLDEIVRNRHRNVHASYDPLDWYKNNIKDITNDFQKEIVGLLNILTFLDFISWDSTNRVFTV